MTGPKLNEAPVIRRRPESRAHAVTVETPSTRAVARHVHVSPYKVRQVLDLIRGHDVQRAQDILRLCERDAAIVVGKLVASAMANAEHNHALVTDELYVSACFADEGPTIKRWRPRARGRATRIRKRTTHVTVIVSRLPDSELRQRRAQRAQAATGRRGGTRRTPATSSGRPERTERSERTGRGRRRDQSTSTGAATSGGVDTTAFAATSPSGPEAEPETTPTEVPTTMADDATPNPDAITERPEVREEGPAAGDSGKTDTPDDDSTGDGDEDKE
jgi:large subunit ribosomal protein L22